MLAIVIVYCRISFQRCPCAAPARLAKRNGKVKFSDKMSKANNRSRPTRQTASQHRYSDMKFAEPSTYNSVYDDQVVPAMLRLNHNLCSHSWLPLHIAAVLHGRYCWACRSRGSRQIKGAAIIPSDCGSACLPALTRCAVPC
jgi:hypothetical protein